MLKKENERHENDFVLQAQKGEKVSALVFFTVKRTYLSFFLLVRQ